MRCTFPLTLALAGLSTAHFILQWPPAAGVFDDDLEPNAPCGSQPVTVDNTSTPINVDRFAVSILVAHPTGEFAFRATTDTSPPFNFVDITPVINSTNIGTFCANYLYAPSDFAGKAGVLQVIDNSVDGVLYQCAPVNFVSGSNNTLGSTCVNTTTTLQWANDPDSFASNTSTTLDPTSAMSTGSASTAAAPSSSTSGVAAMATLGMGLVGGLGMVAAGLLV